MWSDAITDFAQNRFGTDAGLPPDAVHRPPLPDWAARAIGTQAIVEGVTPDRSEGPTVVAAEASDALRTEGNVATRGQPEPANDGSVPDALAYYLPFHFYRNTWGIYIRAEGVWSLARRFALPNKLPSAIELAVAYDLLLEHERFHFVAEYAAARIEVVTVNEPWYPEYFKSEKGSLHEEALANAYALRRLRRHAPPNLAQAAEAWMTTQPPGYRDFSKWLPPAFTRGQREMVDYITASAVAEGILSLYDSPLPHPVIVNRATEFLFRGVPGRRAPVYIVVEPSVPWIRIVRLFPKQFGLLVFVPSNDHKPPHIHVECPPGTFRCRYRWPDLTYYPKPKDKPLRTKEKKQLEKYVDVYRPGIEKKVAKVPWT